MRSSILTKLWIKRLYEKISCVRIYSCLLKKKKKESNCTERGKSEKSCSQPLCLILTFPHEGPADLAGALCRSSPGHPLRPRQLQPGWRVRLPAGGIGPSRSFCSFFPPALGVSLSLFSSVQQGSCANASVSGASQPGSELGPCLRGAQWPPL